MRSCATGLQTRKVWVGNHCCPK